MTDDRLDLATMIEAQLKQRGWQQKTLAHEWHRATGGRKTVSTFESRLSNLMNDEDEGYAFLLEAKDADDRLAGLAKCLDLDPTELRRLAEASRARPTLVFGDHIAENRRLFFEKRATAFPARLRCVRCDGASGGSAREALRDTARKYRNSYVIVDNDRDREFYAGADVRTKHITGDPKGFSIAGIPEISLQRPARTDDDDGMPMFADAKLEAEYRRGGKADQAKWTERIRQADAEDTPVTFRHDWLLEARGFVPPNAASIENAALALAAKAEQLRKHGRMWTEPRADPHLQYLWWHRGRVLAFPEMTYGRDAAAPVPVHDVTTFRPIVEKLANVFRGMNPCGAGPVLFELSAETAAFAEETGLVLNFTEKAIRSTFAQWTAIPTRRDGGTRIHRSPEDDQRVRKALDEILGRPFDVPLSRASAVWMLELVRNAPLLHSRIDESQMEAIADLGTGNMLQFAIRRFASEGPTSMRYWSRVGEREGRDDEVLDGGDIRFTWWKKWLDETLEGTSLKVVERRRARARQAEEDDDD